MWLLENLYFHVCSITEVLARATRKRDLAPPNYTGLEQTLPALKVRTPLRCLLCMHPLRLTEKTRTAVKLSVNHTFSDPLRTREWKLSSPALQGRQEPSAFLSLLFFRLPQLLMQSSGPSFPSHPFGKWTGNTTG